LRQHYYADPQDFTAAITALQQLRDGLVEQVRNVSSQAAHGSYYHQLVHMERRFFKGFCCPGVTFHWYAASFSSFSSFPPVVFPTTGRPHNSGCRLPSTWCSCACQRDFLLCACALS